MGGEQRRRLELRWGELKSNPAEMGAPVLRVGSPQAVVDWL